MHDSKVTSPGVRFPPPLLFVVGLLASLLLQRLWPWPVVTGAGNTRMAGGWGLVAVGVAIGLWGMTTFVRARTAIIPNQPAARLVQSGPYRFTRNPMYVGLSVAYLGAALLINSFWALVLLPLVLLALRLFVIDREERYLAAAFGEEYEEYRRRVGRWL